MIVSGTSALVGGLVGYATQAQKPKAQRHAVLFSVIGAGLGGIAGAIVDVLLIARVAEVQKGKV